MNDAQRLWWEQTTSDHAVLLSLRRTGASPCHLLHYLQMVTEKLGKSYFWRSGKPPKKSHASFVKFLQALNDRSGPDRSRIARIHGFRRADDFENWISSISPLAYSLERLAPTLAGDGPNPEYPWPQAKPEFTPVNFEFEVWDRLSNTGPGRQLLQVIEVSVREFPNFG